MDKFNTKKSKNIKVNLIINLEEFKQINAERELKDTFAHKMLRKFLPKTVKALDSMKPIN